MVRRRVKFSDGLVSELTVQEDNLVSFHLRGYDFTMTSVGITVRVVYRDGDSNSMHLILSALPDWFDSESRNCISRGLGGCRVGSTLCVTSYCGVPLRFTLLTWVGEDSVCMMDAEHGINLSAIVILSYTDDILDAVMRMGLDDLPLQAVVSVV